MKDERQEALEIFYNTLESMPKKEEADNGKYVRFLLDLRKTGTFKWNLNRFRELKNGSLKVKREEIPKKYALIEVILTMREFGITDPDFFDFTDPDTVLYIQDFKKRNKWDENKKLTESAPFTLYCF